MNIILLGGTVSKRLQIKNDLKVRITKNKIIFDWKALEFYDMVIILGRGPIKMNPIRKCCVANHMFITLKIIWPIGTRFSWLDWDQYRKLDGPTWTTADHLSYLYHWPTKPSSRTTYWTVKSAWLNSTRALVVCGDFIEPTENILQKYKTELNGIIFDATNDISKITELPLNLAESADGKKSISKYYGSYYRSEDVAKTRTEEVQLTADGNFIRPDEYYFYGESFDFETYSEKLKTKQIGQHFYHFNTISSTMVRHM